MVANNCPHCGVSLLGEPIPVECRCGETCSEACVKHPYPKTATHFHREIGIEVSRIYDGVLYWMCPDCKHKWHRWPEGDPRREAASAYVGR